MRVSPDDLHRMVNTYIQATYSPEDLAEMYEEDFEELQDEVRVGLQSALEVLEPMSPY